VRADGALRLHLGGEEPHAGWQILNVQPGPGVDYVGDCADLGRFGDESVDDIYASHVLEHLGYAQKLPNALREWRRVLKKGGRARISVPDLDVLSRLFLDAAGRTHDRIMIMRMMFGGQVDEHDFHYVGLSFDILASLLGDAGFSHVERVAEFGLFKDTSAARMFGEIISLNVVAYK
jgi:predicted SAM-dependent methyltransferase